MGKEIFFPEGITCTSMGKDTICVDLYGDNYKILLFVDSMGCTSCRLNLVDWRKLISESDTSFIRKPEYVFIFQPKKNGNQELYTILRSSGFRYPVFIDKDNEFNKNNKFLSNPEFQCFLLDKDNKIVMVGNPSLIKRIWILYKKVITESEAIVLTKGNGGKLTCLLDRITLSTQLFPNKERSTWQRNK